MRTIVLLLITLTLSADDVVESRKFMQAAQAAQKAKDNAGWLTNVRAAAALRPQHAGLLVELAAALEANEQHDEAVRTLQRVADMGLAYPRQKDFSAERWGSVGKAFEANTRPIGVAKREHTIDRLGLIPEGMAWDGKRLFVSSVRTKTIFAIDGKGTVTPFATGPWGVFGMTVDAKRGVLWATTMAQPQVEGFTPEMKGRSALLRIDLRRGRILDTLTVAEGEHNFGDVTLAPDGEVYVSDSGSAVVYKVRQEGETFSLEPFFTGPIVSMQGLAVVGEKLYGADYSKGLFVVDRRTLDHHFLRVPANVSLLGVDGLYAVDERTLVATQNGTFPNRIIRIRLTPGGVAVESVRTLLANAPAMGDPTLGVVAGNRFFFNGNAQWELFDENGKISDPLKLTEAVVLSVPLR